MKICVTGGAGFIGSHLTDKLVKQGNEVVVIDNLSTGLEHNINPKAKFVKADLSARNHKFEKAFNELKNCDQIYHLAATVGYKKVLESPLKCFTNNVDSLKAVIEACELTNTKVLFTSSSEVYGTKNYSALEGCFGGYFTNPQNGKDCYAVSKWVGEFLLSWNPSVNSVIVRLFNTSGPRQRPDFGMVIPSFVKTKLDKQKAVVTSGGEQRRCFCHVSETVDALIKLMNKSSPNASIYNIGNPYNKVTIKDLALMINDDIFYETLDNYHNHIGFEDSTIRFPNIQKITFETGWKPVIGVKQIIEDNKRWQEGTWKS